MKVLHLITKLELGGAQRNTLHTVRHLDPARFEARLASGPGGLLDREAPDALRVPALDRPVRPLADLAALRSLRRLLAEERPDILHTHSSKAGILGRIAARLSGVPVVVHTFHGFGFHVRQSAPARALYVLLERLCARWTDALVFVSRANEEEARRRGIGEPSRHRLIRSGIDFDAVPPKGADRAALRKELGVPPEAPLVLSVGNLKPQKNPLDFVRLAARVRASSPGARFVFVGDGELRPQVEALVRKEGLGEAVRFPGWKGDASRLLPAADVFVLTSLWEGLPRALVEAMRSGLACACYDVDGVRDVLRAGENGWTAPAGDVDALAGRVAGLLADPGLRERLGRAARESIGPEFDIRGMVRRQEELYLELAGGAA